jgi:tetratricopeptide (TPR) repeat protein
MIRSVTSRALVAALVLSLAAGCGTAESRKAKALDKGNAFLAEGNLDKARVEYRNALQLAPNDAEARYRNGVVLEKQGHIREAGQFYQGAIDVQPAHAAARAALARLYLFAGSPERAMELVKPVLEKTPNDAQLLTVRAAARAALKDEAGALEDAEAAVAHAPEDESAVALLAGLLNRNARSDRAVALLEKGVAQHPTSVDLRLALAQLYASLKEPAKAEHQLRELVRLEPQQAGHRVRLAQYLTAAGQADDAEKALREGAAALPESAPLRDALLSFLAERRGRPAARAELDRLIAARPDDPAIKFTAARFMETGGEYAEAAKLYEQVIAREGTKAPGLSAKTRLAALRAGQNDRATAERLVAEVLAESPRDADALLLRGNLLLAKGDAKDAIADLRAVLRDQPTAVGVLRVLARAHLANGEAALAEETLRRAVDAAPTDRDARLDLAGLLAQSGKPEQAVTLLEPLAKTAPNDLGVQQAFVQAALRAKDAAAARRAADRILELQPNAPLAHYYAGLVAEVEGHRDDALGEYGRALALQPDSVDALTAQTRLLVAAKNAPEALKRLDAAAANPAAAVHALTLKGELLVSERRYSDGESALRSAVERAPGEWPAYRLLAVARVAQKDVPGAVALLGEALGKVKDPVPLRAELATLLEGQGRIDDAIAQYDAIVASQPANQAARNNLAMLLASHRTDPASRQRALTLAQSFADSQNPLFVDTYGWVQLKAGNPAAALPALERAHAAAPDSAVVRYHLGMAQLAGGQDAAARRSLADALASGQPFPGIEDARSTLDRLAAAK